MNPVAAGLRQRARLCRRAASSRTQGDRTVDLILIELAEKLERIAEDLERGMRTQSLDPDHSDSLPDAK